jgi:hypothetical protein
MSMLKATTFCLRSVGAAGLTVTNRPKNSGSGRLAVAATALLDCAYHRPALNARCWPNWYPPVTSSSAPLPMF